MAAAFECDIPWTFHFFSRASKSLCYKYNFMAILISVRHCRLKYTKVKHILTRTAIYVHGLVIYQTQEVHFPECFLQTELSGGPLSHKYRLEQFHLHWGATDDRGSEHTIDGCRYAAEVSIQLERWFPVSPVPSRAVSSPLGSHR